MSCSPFARLSALAVFAAVLSFTGCGAGPAATSGAGSLAIRGSIYGGQQPVSGSSVKLYAAGKSGNGSAATPMLVLPVMSLSDGSFTLTGDYVCANVEDQVYLTATGGNPGLTSGTNNAALVMMSALGRCGDLPTTPFVNINELTTVAAVWALAPFINSAANVGATSTNAAGLKNGFLNATLLIDPRLGGFFPALPSNLTIETGKISALANSIASCVNSDGGAGCMPLFSAATPSGGTAPTNTLQAALNIVRNPANKVTAVYQAAGSFPPFPTTQTSAPNDWTMSMTVTGGGLSLPTALAVDAGGNVWVADYPGALSGFTPQGTPLSATGFGIAVLSNAFGLTVDTGGNVWVSSSNMPTHGSTVGSVSKFAGSASGSPGSLAGTFSDVNLNYPEGLAADTNGNIMIGNYAGGFGGSIYNGMGGVVSSMLGVGSVAFPVAVAADSTHGIWLANQSDTTVTHVAANGTVLAHPSCCDDASGIAVDAFGNAWVANFGNDSVSEVSAAGTTTLASAKGGGLSTPSGVVIDGAQDVWTPNYSGGSFSHLAGNGGATAAGTAISPSSGFGKDASLAQPFAIAIDATGDVWLSNYSNSDVVMFFGIASPTKTPVGPVPALP
jgi:hypothetical protein